MKIPIKKYVDDPTLSWEERYRRLEAHHKEETEWLIAETVRLVELNCVKRTVPALSNVAALTRASKRLDDLISGRVVPLVNFEDKDGYVTLTFGTRKRIK